MAVRNVKRCMTVMLGQSDKGTMDRQICIKCEKEIPLNETAIQLSLGQFKKDEFGGIAYEQPKDTIWDTLGYIHYDCK